MQIVERKFSPSTALTLIKGGVPSVLARVMAARGILDIKDAALGPEHLIPYSELTNAEAMARVLADAIIARKRLLIIADYDADGATACSVGLLALRAFGARVDYLIPNRLEHGYGLTPEIVEIACPPGNCPDYLITVDNGIASHQGIELANRLGVPVLVTDHHLPAATHPDALVIVNPSQHGCAFPSKALAGCGVIYYVMWALQDELFSRDYQGMDPDFDIFQLLPIVAIGTVADVVALDTNNRILVKEGLRLIRAGKSFPGVEALALVSGKKLETLSTSDIAFGLGPRINAAGRLQSMNAGVQCLTTDSVDEAKQLAQQLHNINDKRKEIEGEMTEEAVRRLLTDVQPNRYTAVLHSNDWHQGVIGIVAGRLKEKIWRPTFVLANGKTGEMKGSGRSIPCFHLRDALDIVNKRAPGVLLKFGGHAMAAGVTIAAERLDEFTRTFEEVARSLLKPSDLNQDLEVDGGLEASEMCESTVTLIKNQVWGQGFPEPAFCDKFLVVKSRPIGDGQHLKLVLQKDGRQYDAVKFRHADGPPPALVNAVYKLDTNTYKGETKLQLLVEFLEPA